MCFTGDMTDVAAQVKLMWARGRCPDATPDEIGRIIGTDVGGEITAV